MLVSDKPKRDGSQWPLKERPCKGGCGAQIQYRLKPKAYCPACVEKHASQSPRAVAVRRSRERRSQGLIGFPFVCEICSTNEIGKVPHRKCCVACRDEWRRRLSAAKNAANGSIPLGTVVQCPNCKAPTIKVFKASDYCEACRKLSERENLPFQIDRKRAWFAKYGRERRKADPQYAINQRMSANIKNSIVSGKNGRRWESLVGFTITDLMAHLETQFTKGMNWENRGEWHIDHIRPLCSFEFQTPDDPQFREAWALTNLQPLWAVDNLRKGGGWDGELTRATEASRPQPRTVQRQPRQASTA